MIEVKSKIVVVVLLHILGHDMEGEHSTQLVLLVDVCPVGDLGAGHIHVVYISVPSARDFQFNIVHFNIVQINIVQFNIVQFSIFQFNIIQFNIVQFNIGQFNIVQFNIVQFNIVQFNIVQFNIVQ